MIVTWAALLALDWVLVYWPLPAGGARARHAAPGGPGSVVDGLYVSPVALTTPGFGDVPPILPLLRVLATLEAATGFGRLTAGISSVLSAYAVLDRRRTLVRCVPPTRPPGWSTR